MKIYFPRVCMALQKKWVYHVTCMTLRNVHCITLGTSSLTRHLQYVINKYSLLMCATFNHASLINWWELLPVHTDTAVSSAMAGDVNKVFVIVIMQLFRWISTYLTTRIPMKVTTTCSHKVSNRHRTCMNLTKITQSQKCI